MNKRLIITGLAILLSLAGGALVISRADAVTGADWQAGNIIDDAVFNNGNDMTSPQIQEFLNNKVPVCDTQGTQNSEYGGGTRAQYGTAHNNPPPYVCLKNYYENPTTHENNLSGRPIPAGGISAADIIYYAAQNYSINPKVLIATLQKESVGPLVTDTWPFASQYKVPMGYACPDTAPCDSQYFGFYNQVTSAAQQFRRYANNPNNYRHKPGQVNAVRYNPSSACGSSNVYIVSQPTASLYNYTPYQPNQAALNNLYGTGDGCSAYGNRNFWRIYNDWFGSTHLVNGTITLSQGLVANSHSGIVYNGETVTATFQVSNSADYDVNAGGFGVCARINGQHYDFGFTDQNTIVAHGVLNMSFSKTIDKTGNLQLFICSYHPAMGWSSDTYPYAFNGPVTRALGLTAYENPVITTGISFSPATPAIGQPVTATYTVRNFASNPVVIGAMILAARDPNGANVDFGEDANVTVPGSSTYTFSKTRTFSTPGDYSAFIMNWRGAGYDPWYPKSVDGTIVRKTTLHVLDNPLVTAGVTLSPVSPAAGQPTTATVTIRNASASDVNIGTFVVAARSAGGANVDFPAASNITITAGTTYTYSVTQRFMTAGAYNFFMADLHGGVWDTGYPKSLDSTIVRKGNFTVTDNPVIMTGITLSPASPTLNQTITATVTIRNLSSDPVNIGTLAIAGRDPNGANVDFPADASTTIPANTTITYSKSRTFTVPGTYTFFLADLHSGVWDRQYPKSVDSTVLRQLTVPIN